MRDLDEAGFYRGFCVGQRIGRTRRNRCFFLKLQCEAQERWDHGWHELEEALSFTGMLFLTKKDGTLNDYQFASLTEAFGWTGESVAALARAELANTLVVFVLEDKEQTDGTVVPELSWVNHQNWVPGRGMATDDELSEMDVEWRKITGGAAGGAAPPPDDAPPVDGLGSDSQIPF